MFCRNMRSKSIGKLEFGKGALHCILVQILTSSVSGVSRRALQLLQKFERVLRGSMLILQRRNEG